MHKKTGLICCFPTTVVAIDDTPRALNALKANIDEKLHHCRTYTDPKKALAYLKTHCKNILTLPLKTALDNDDDPDFDLSQIHREISDKNRFLTPTTVIVDYAMPGINGVDFCLKIKDLPVAKIMLTGKADEILAVNAFNEGIIDKFIRKGSNEEHNKINDEIYKIQKNHFRKLSASIIDQINEGNNLLNNKKFVAFFEALCKKNEIVEYYLVESGGSFLLIDIHGRIKFFVAKTDNDFVEYCYAGKDDGAADEILKDLETRKRIPFFGLDKKFWQIPASNWDEYLYTAYKCGDIKNCYYAWIDNPQLSKQNEGKVFSYRQFLGE